MTSKNSLLMLMALGALMFLIGCDDDDIGTPVTGEESFTLTIENMSTAADYPVSGVFNTPVGSKAPGPIFPGDVYEFTFGANPGDKLSFATMFVQSNDLFYAPDGDGIDLFSGMTPVDGDVTSQVYLWDSGTEMNEAPGEGANQAPRQTAANMGALDANTAVRLVNDGFTYPMVSDVVEVTISHLGANYFRASIENVSTEMTLMTGSGTVAVPLAPGAFVVHSLADPLFTEGMADMLGLEGLAEDGDPGALLASLEAQTGLAVPLAPGVAVVHSSAVSLFTAGMMDAGLGLEELAEDGNPGVLSMGLDGVSGVESVTVFDTAVGNTMPSPIFPGDSYSVSFVAMPGDRLSLATMFVHSNDLFYAFDGAGLALFDSAGDPMIGDVTMYIYLWDAGTEINQFPGVGPDQAPHQAAANTGAVDPNTTVRMVNDDFSYPMSDQVIRVSLTVAN